MPSLDNLTSNCPQCFSQGTLYQKIIHSVYGQHYDIYKCSSCSVCYTFPFPSTELLTSIYSGKYWLRGKKANSPGNLTGVVQSFNRARLAAMVRPLAKRLKPGDRILEVGCGSGQLAIYLRQSGFDVEVTDISEGILSEIAKHHNIHGYCGDLNEISFDGALYNSVIFNNVLEHLEDPENNLKIASKILKQDGLIFIEVPNIDSFQFKLFRQKWFPLQLPQHLFHFSPDSLQIITQNTDLEKIWLSTFSPRVSAAGYVASLFPFLSPDRLRHSMSKPLLILYLALQFAFFPIAYIESLFGYGSAIRAIYRKKRRIQ